MTASASRHRAARHEPTDQGKPLPGGLHESGVGRSILAMRTGGVNTQFPKPVRASRHRGPFRAHQLFRSSDIEPAAHHASFRSVARNLVVPRRSPTMSSRRTRDLVTPSANAALDL